MKILYLGPNEGFESISDHSSEKINLYNCPIDKNIFDKEIKDSDGLIDASMKIPINDEIENISNKLKVISTATTGSDHIDIEFVESFDNVILCFDNDKYGREAARKVARIIKPGKSKIVSLPQGFKDANVTDPILTI